MPTDLHPSSSPLHPSASAPTARDFLAYERTIVDGASTRQVATELDVSQTRVRQLVHRVLTWLEQTLPPADDDHSAAKLRLAQHIAADRIERYQSQADRLWQQTGETSYAALALRFLMAQSRLPAIPGTLAGLGWNAILSPTDKETETPTSPSPPTSPPPQSHPLPQSAINNPQSTIPPSLPTSFIPPPSSFPPSPPPSGDCSAPTAPHPNHLQSPTTPTPTPTSTSPQLSDRHQAARAAFFTPAHNPLDSVKNSPTELKITPESLSLSTSQQTSIGQHTPRSQLRRRSHTG